MDDHDGDDAEQLAKDLEKLGPTFIKLGQLLSGRSDLLPPASVEALTRLQDNVEPFPYADVEQIVEAELGVRISKAFGLFEQEPLAAASTRSPATS
jgi:ubiquinone biosynthesis protein